MEQLEHIFRSETSEKISLIKDRQWILQELGSVILEKYQGNIVNLVKRYFKKTLRTRLFTRF